MIARAEELFGPYDWDRYDMLVLPPSFPYGGMENPRMTFLTPTLLAGDRSLVDVVAHELAHSWTGNLVTNADMEHFWLNEGFTVWAERRLLEALHGEEATVLAWAIGEKALEESLERFGAGSPLTRLRTELAGVDPDDVFSSMPVREGRALRHPARADGGTARASTASCATTSPASASRRSPPRSSSPSWRSELPGLAAGVGARGVALRAGPAGERARLPLRRGSTASSPSAAGLRRRGERPDRRRRSPAGAPPRCSSTSRTCRARSTATAAPGSTRALGLTARGNYEILVEWLTIAAGSDYEPAFPRLREVLLRVGRMKYLRPLYGALGRHPRTRALAREVFAEAAPRYHALSRRVAASVIEKYSETPAS